MKSCLSARIRTARKHLGMTASRAAELAGLTRKSWERYELDKSEPRATSLTMLVEHGIDGTWLLTGTGNMTQADTQKSQPNLDPELLRKIIEELENFRQQHNPDWSNQQISQIISLGYQMMESQEAEKRHETIKNLQFLMLAATL
nr:helix-turn-helix transcriptional regulator [Thalassospira profundimaris]